MTRYVPGGKLTIRYRPSAFVSPEKLTFVLMFVASTFTSATTSPWVSVILPVNVASSLAKTALTVPQSRMIRQSTATATKRIFMRVSPLYASQEKSPLLESAQLVVGL